ncbi:hypothetical protein P153DRAFT_421144 [Dothidotthia symphoricarpi CBS 119687]|uniref:Uncharacterized protein n=1 Tax=Dothidotthia symphoricarpi CBS 119687 TaxID=1392245 RepID=A0A6A6AM02_9PLEO|nr:uncharacterized protein P153DRAFT_421144 [Dothidotthia symphoricarpi CBS 119687]KAF2132115.1 hypothetical protein P153DRAFT_421144 [Dothidotthia symphoricarpi CBS 119687]
MPSDKDRLYVALYARSGAPKMPGGEDKYHWAFLIGPKVEANNVTGRRCHAKESMQAAAGVFKSVWVYEDRAVSLQPTSAILVRIMIGKVTDGARLAEAFAKTPIRAGHAGYESWNCVSWIQEALSLAAHDGKALGSSRTDWKFVRDTAMWYVAEKAAKHRFDGQGQFDVGKVPTWDALEKKETVA